MTVKFILFIALINVVVRLVFGKSNALYCGLVGFSGKDPKDFDRDKFNIMGIQNEKRGTHSCGIAIDGEVQKGVNKESAWRDFIALSPYENPKKIPVVIGHTRMATQGAHTETNAHPFKYEHGKEKYVIAAHNGVIRNYRDLADKYEIKEGLRIDSDIFLEILSRGESTVLQEYIGNAAVLMYSSVTPNALWVFRGESKLYNTSAYTEAERPLWFYQTPDKRAMYVSSLAEPLRAISAGQEDADNNIKEFKTNILYRIEGGEIVDRFIINRDNCFRGAAHSVHGTRTTSHTNHNAHNAYAGNTRSAAPVNNRDSAGFRSSANPRTPMVRDSVAGPSSSITAESYKRKNIHYENLVSDGPPQDIFYENFRFKHFPKKELVTGVCIFIKPIGFVKVGDNEIEALTKMKNLIYKDTRSGYEVKFGNQLDVTLFYFYRGIMLKKKEDLTACLNNDFTTLQLSHVSMYPIIDIRRIENQVTKVYPNEQHALHDGQLATSVFSPAGSTRQYEVNNGNLDWSKLRNYVQMPSTPRNQDNPVVLDLNEDGEWKDFIDKTSKDNPKGKANVEETDEGGDFDSEIEQELMGFDGTESGHILSINEDIGSFLAIIQDEIDNVPEGTIKNTLHEFITESMIKYAPISKLLRETEAEILNKI